MSKLPQPQQTEEKMDVVGTEKNKEEENDIISKFKESMKNLNISFFNALENAVSENPSAILLPLIKDYLYHCQTLLEKYSIKDDSYPSPKTFKSLGIFFDDLEMSIFMKRVQLSGVAGELEQTPKRKIDDADNEVYSNTSLDLNAELTCEPAAKKIAASPNSNPFANKDFVDSDQNSEKDAIKIVHEPDALHSTRCKIFQLLEKCLKFRGAGMLYIKKLEDNRYQMLVRADNSQGTVILNMPLERSLRIAMKGKDAITTVDFVPSEYGMKAVPIVIRMANEVEANKLVEKIQEFQNA